MLNILSMFIGPEKIGGWVRAAVASALAYLATKYGLQVFNNPELVAGLGAAASAVMVGIWSSATKANTVAVPANTVINPDAPIDERIPVNTVVKTRAKKSS